MRIVVLEDDFLQAEWIEQVLHETFGGVQMERIPTEHEFRSRLDQLRIWPPDLVLIDIMMRWTDPDSHVIAPVEVSSEGYYRAGLRCERLLRNYKETSNVAVILYTVLDEIDLKSEIQHLNLRTRYVEKNSDPGELIGIIKELCGVN